ncbi:MAG TPA: DEAD/DEAH box helicase [Candidatus Thalassarchaeaceae archaeon]|nr:DEAD/DEAH box helicase [Candidatus Thalassarchaeaceae archaeon]HJN69952.1 DEAD/DEAH box helicase [Candidatus Thalassarchaeaceae archaeon]
MAAGEDLAPVSLADIKLDQRLIEFLRSEWGIEELFPPQQEALPYSLSGRNLMLTIPTASGKSLVAHLTIIQRLLTDLEGCRGLYIVPLKALASEKVEELRELAELVGLTVGIAIGDRGGETESIEEADILVCTSEKLDSLLRTRSNLMEKIGVVVSDEFHLLHDIGRGPTLEVLLSRIRHSRPEAQIIALSATVGNGTQMAEWLDAKLIESDWRPIRLHSGTLTGLDVKVHRIDGPGGGEWPEPRTIEGKKTRKFQAVLDDTVDSAGQILIFVNSRASAQKEARELAKYVVKEVKQNSSRYNEKMAEEWNSIAEKMTRSEDTSVMGRALSNAIRGGIAFHHAGLSHTQRKTIEDSFRKGALLAIVATPTLAQGVNLPARRVIVRDYRRWSSVAGGSMPVPVMEIRQMLGRAGRPKYDNAGDAWIVAKDDDEELNLVDRYLLSDAEEVTSKLANPSALRPEEDPALLTHLLSIIATSGIRDRDALSRFFGETFLATQIESDMLESRIDDVVNWLTLNEMITKNGESKEVLERIKNRQDETSREDENWQDEMPTWAKTSSSIPGLEITEKKVVASTSLTPRKGPAIFGFRKASLQTEREEILPDSAAMTYEATALGQRVARLYLNPISGRIIHDGLKVAMDVMRGVDDIHQISPLGLLHLAACTPDFIALWPRKEEWDLINSAIHNHEREFLAEPVDSDQERRMKGVLVLQEWIEETKMEDLENRWNVQPGDLRSRVDLAEWLLFAMREILSEDEELRNIDPEGHRDLVDAVSELHRRVRYGCKTELLGLVTIRGVGRTRAREMMKLLGVETALDVASLTEKDSSKLADLRGWSPKLVSNIVAEASRVSRRR